MINQESQTDFSGDFRSYPKTYLVDANQQNVDNNERTPQNNSNGRVSANNSRSDEGDEFDPLYAIPSNLGKNKNGQITPTNNNCHSLPLQSSSPVVEVTGHILSSQHSSPNSLVVSPTSKANKSFNFERSQSFRISRKSQRSYSAGGSLR